MIAAITFGAVFPYALTAIVAFVLGILVGRRNVKLVNTLVADVKVLEAKVEALVEKKTTTPVVVTPVIGSTTPVSGSK